MKSAVCLLFPVLLVSGTLLAIEEKDYVLLEKYQLLQPDIDRAQAALLRNAPQKCEKYVRKCLEQLPEHNDAHYLLAQILYGRGDFVAALEQVQAAEAGFISREEAVFRFHQERLRSQIDEEQQLANAASGLSADAAAAVERGSCKVSAYVNEAQQARKKLADYVRDKKTSPGERVPVPAGYRCLHGNCLFRLKRLPEAEAEYRAALAVEPGHGQANNNMINLLFMTGRLAEARTLLGQAEANGAAVQPGLKKAVAEAAVK